MQQSDRRSTHRKLLGMTSNTHELFLNWRNLTHIWTHLYTNSVDFTGFKVCTTVIIAVKAEQTFRPLPAQKGITK